MCAHVSAKVMMRALLRQRPADVTSVHSNGALATHPTVFHIRADDICPRTRVSGNAATTLWAANEAAGRPATAAQLLDWSAAIGSDISVFFSRGAAYCTGRHAASAAAAAAAAVL